MAKANEKVSHSQYSVPPSCTSALSPFSLPGSWMVALSSKKSTLAFLWQKSCPSACFALATENIHAFCSFPILLSFPHSRHLPSILTPLQNSIHCGNLTLHLGGSPQVYSQTTAQQWAVPRKAGFHPVLPAEQWCWEPWHPMSFCSL